MRLMYLDTVNSTMDVAREELKAGRVRCDRPGRRQLRGVVAQEQTEGRGQRGRTWYSPHGESLSATYFRPRLASPEAAGEVALLAGVAVANVLRTEVKRTQHKEEPSIQNPKSKIQNPDVGLKWPNDLLLNGKKAGGILVELVQSPECGWTALIGVGINVQVRELPAELADLATSLWLEGISHCSPNALAENIADSLDRVFARWRAEGLEAILRRWRAYDRTPSRRYQMEHDGVTLEGVAEGVDEAGALLLRADDGRLLITRFASSLREIPPP